MLLFLQILGTIFLCIVVFAIVYSIKTFISDQKELYVANSEAIYENEQLLANIKKANKRSEILIYEIRKDSGLLCDEYEKISQILVEVAKLPIPQTQTEEAVKIANYFKGIVNRVNTNMHGVNSFYQNNFKEPRTVEKAKGELLLPGTKFLFNKN